MVQERGRRRTSGDDLFEIETDKTSMEVPATFAGTLSTSTFQVGEVAKVGAVVAVITGAGEAPPPAKSAAPAPSATGARPHAAQTSNGASLDPWNAVRTPERISARAPQRRDCLDALARRLAAERGVDIVDVRERGPMAGRRPRCRRHA